MCVCVCVCLDVCLCQYLFPLSACFLNSGHNCLLLLSCYLGMGVPSSFGSQPMSVSQPFWGIPPTSTVSVAPSVSTEQVRLVLCVICVVLYIPYNTIYVITMCVMYCIVWQFML